MKRFLLIFCIIISYSMCFALSQNERAERQYKFISKLYENKSYAQVIDEGKKLVKFSPRFRKLDAIYFILGESAYQLKQYENAQKYFETVLQKYPKSSLVQNSHHSLGWLYFINKNYNKSVLYFSKVTKRNLVEESNYKCGEAYYALNDYDKAIEKFKLCTENEGKYFDRSLYHLGICYSKKDDINNAKIVFDHLVRRNKVPSLVTYSKFQIAEIYYNNEEYPKAIDLYESILRQSDPSEKLREDITYSLGWAYIRSKQYNKAIDIFKTLQNSATYADESYYRIIKCYYYLKDHDTVISLANKQKNNKYFSQILYWKAFSYYKKDDYKNAGSVFSQIIESNNQDIKNEAVFMIATCKNKLGKYTEAIDWYKKITLNKENTADILYQIGQCYFNLKEYDKAQQQFKTIAEKHADHEKADNAIFEIGECFYNQQKYQQARDYFNKLISQFPDSSVYKDAIIRIGECYLAENNYDKAIETFEKLKDLPASNNSLVQSEILFGLGQCYIKTKLWDKALETYKKIELSETGRFKYEAKFKIAEIYHLKKQYETAKKIFRELFKDKNCHLRFSAQFMVGEIYRENKEYMKAIQEYRKLLSYDFENKERLFFSAAWSYIQLKNYQRAAMNYEYILSNFNKIPVLSKAAYWLAKTYELQKNYDKAAKQYLSVAVMYPEYEHADYSLLNAGENYKRIGKNDSAENCFNDLLKDFPKSTYADQAKKKLKSMK